MNWGTAWEMLLNSWKPKPPKIPERPGLDSQWVAGGRFGQVIGVVSVLDNGYLLSFGPGDGRVSQVCFAKDELSVGQVLLECVAKEQMK